ncbi:MAG: hypothetical protein RIC57_09115 [Balneola sp.]
MNTSSKDTELQSDKVEQLYECTNCEWTGKCDEKISKPDDSVSHSAWVLVCPNCANPEFFVVKKIGVKQ